MGPIVKNQFHFTGWNGNDSQYGSSLLEHISTFKTKKYVWAYDVENYRSLTYASIKLKSANYPYGKCIQVSHSNSSSLKNYLMIRKSPKIGNVNNTIIILLRDPVNSAHLFPISFSMAGDKMVSGRHKNLKKYKIKIKQLIHEKEDPHFPCREYSPKNTFNSCVHNELLIILQRHFGCIPPLFSQGSNQTCNDLFDQSEKESANTVDLLDAIFSNHHTKGCLTPCTKTVYEITMLYEVPAGNNGISISFNEEVDIERSVFRITPRPSWRTLEAPSALEEPASGFSSWS